MRVKWDHSKENFIDIFGMSEEDINFVNRYLTKVIQNTECLSEGLEAVAKDPKTSAEEKVVLTYFLVQGIMEKKTQKMNPMVKLMEMLAGMEDITEKMSSGISKDIDPPEHTN